MFSNISIQTSSGISRNLISGGQLQWAVNVVEREQQPSDVDNNAMFTGVVAHLILSK